MDVAVDSDDERAGGEHAAAKNLRQIVSKEVEIAVVTPLSKRIRACICKSTDRDKKALLEAEMARLLNFDQRCVASHCMAG